MAIEDLLKAQGYTDAEIEASKALLADPKLRGTLETAYSKLESDLTSFKTENENWSKWHEDHGKPTLALYEKDRADALAETASLKERLRLAEEAGFAPRRTEPTTTTTTTTPTTTPAAFNPKDHNLVTTEELGRLANLEGQAIAMAADLNEEYRRLTGGQSLISYETEIDGRQVRGMQALRLEAMQKKQPLDQYVSSKFDFAGKRKVIADKQKADAEEAIRVDERAKLAKQYGDPNVRTPMPSTNPFMPRPDKENKQPWDSGKTPAQLKSERLQRAMETQYKGALN